MELCDGRLMLTFLSLSLSRIATPIIVRSVNKESHYSGREVCTEILDAKTPRLDLGYVRGGPQSSIYYASRR